MMGGERHVRWYAVLDDVDRFGGWCVDVLSREIEGAVKIHALDTDVSERQRFVHTQDRIGWDVYDTGTPGGVAGEARIAVPIDEQRAFPINTDADEVRAWRG